MLDSQASFCPSASITDIKKRAQLLFQLRAFFYARDVIEVDPPVLGESPVTDVYIDSLVLTDHSLPYLQTSPEFYMKRLLAAGSGSIYSLGKAFRRDENGRCHRAEFTMLEWYREGFDDKALIQEMEALFEAVGAPAPIEKVTYGDLFETHVGLDPYQCSLADLQQKARVLLGVDWDDTDPCIWLDLLFTHCVEPNMPEGLIIVEDYPAVMCALARVAPNAQGVSVARRFEVFWGGVELANGYWELTDSVEQERRFKEDLDKRKAQGKSFFPYDQKLIAALAHGIPECAGVAMGVDRLLMCLLGYKDIAKVMPFADG